MAEIAFRLKSISSLILEHSYSYESFGSWWFIFRRTGQKYRVVFDGRDKYLSLESAVVSDGSKTIAEWQSIGGKQLPNTNADSLILEVDSLISH